MAQKHKLEQMTRGQLEEVARERRLDIPQSQMNKGELIEAIKQKETSSKTSPMGQLPKLEQMKRGELEQFAQERNLNIPQSEMNKGQLIDAIKESGGGSGDSSKPGRGGGQGDTPAPEGARPEDYKNIPGNQT